MANYQNHLIDPTFFYDVIEEFSFDYDIYVVTGKSVDDSGKTVRTYKLQTIRGSLQSKGSSLEKGLQGNSISKTYEFYCKSLYRINIGDVIEYKGNFYRTESVDDYDEFGVRSCSLTLVKLSTMRDLNDYVAYLRGEKLV